MAAVGKLQPEPQGLIGVAADARVERPATFRHACLVLGPLFIFLTIFAWVIALTIPQFSGPSGAGYGSDFAMFYEAAKVQSAGLNPYNADLLWKRERADFARAGIRKPSNRAQVRVGNPPLLFWALGPLAGLPFRTAGIIWTAGVYLLSLLGFLMILIGLGWRRWALSTAVFLTMPQVVIGAFYGNVIGIIFAAVAGVILMARRYPFLAGMLLGACWLKPHIALPVVLLVWAFHTDARKRLFLGFCTASAAFWGLTVAVVGVQGADRWMAALLGYTRDIAGQPEISSIAGLYYRWAPLPLRTGLSVLFLVGAFGATMLTWRRLRGRLPEPLTIAWLWALWIVCVPYAHIDDEILLALPVLALLGRNGRDALSWPSVATLYLLCSCLLLNRLPGVPIDLEPLKLSAIVAVLAWAAWNERRASIDQPALAPVSVTSSA